ncbi:MAG: ribose 5-phosphate isomerase B [Clostridia bacterium]|nr:ribose 5-phosphate isomerase B [Clostridia bacterium]
MKLAIGADHGGYLLKEEVKKWLDQHGVAYEDFGTFSEASVDYPVIAAKVGHAIVDGQCDRGILVCGTGIGISIAANKIKGIRAAVCADEFCAEYCRRHNNANILCMGGRVLSTELALRMVDLYLNTEFEGGRHQRRVDMFTALENEEM